MICINTFQPHKILTLTKVWKNLPSHEHEVKIQVFLQDCWLEAETLSTVAQCIPCWGQTNSDQQGQDKINQQHVQDSEKNAW